MGKEGTCTKVPGDEFSDIKIKSLFPIRNIYSKCYLKYVSRNPYKIVWFLYEPHDPRIRKAVIIITTHKKTSRFWSKDDIKEIIRKCKKIPRD